MKKTYLFMTLAAMMLTATVFTSCGGDDPVEPDPVKVTSVAFKANPEALEIGDEFTFEVTVLPENADDKTVTWDSSDKAIATVSAGVVKALAAGTTTISATAADGSGKKAEFEVTVNEVITNDPVVTIAFAEGLTDEVNEIKYSEAVDGEGNPAKEIVVEVSANNGIGKMSLKLTTENRIVNSILPVGEEIELGGESMPLELAAILSTVFGDGLPFVGVTGQKSATLDFSAMLSVIAGLTGGIEQFDIEINAEDVNGIKAETKTLKLKFVDDLKVEITGDGIGEEPLEILKSVAMGETPTPVVVNIAAPQGIENFKVQISSSSPAFMGLLAFMGLEQEFDLANPGVLADVFSNPPVNLPNGDAVKGETELEFNITHFVPMIFGAAGECTADFKLTVTDTKGTTATETIALSLVYDSTEE